MPRHIIVVEDDLPLRYAYAKLLENEGYIVHPFADYMGVTELFDGGTGDLLVSDILLPSGTPHGIAIAAMVKAHRPGIPVLFVTGYPDYLEHVPLGATVLIKPVLNDELLAVIAACIKR
jgi:DNA-binding NtrC family response regulator